MYQHRDYDTRDDGSEIFVADNYLASSNNNAPHHHHSSQHQQQQHGHHHQPNPNATSPRPPSSALSSNYYKPESVVSTSKKNKAGIVLETMSAPNPFCPRSKGVCCLLVLINLGLILVTLGFSIVLQLFEPAFVWYCGILFLIVGFIALISSLVFCVSICRENEHRSEDNYWTHHWQKRIDI